ncbi:putative bifunctional diguanylate cyclase/phosphodiesterase [Paenibacillus aquistagni]|uniref:putative bifunctional diguanylate cyclase/phosphodiesterase n=1 Tax=Paenibacillus aquistagni TaxID=1852522 RepID=UPI00145B411B|nr:bifunctional diguanylate cyclase/phosphodiesterase [Paenibacillus aquistagni]NMM53772.1 bifunctional diguanylate cyclase/phosphodiesterase [Paenibacillus aquistagni]
MLHDTGNTDNGVFERLPIAAACMRLDGTVRCSNRSFRKEMGVASEEPFFLHELLELESDQLLEEAKNVAYAQVEQQLTLAGAGERGYQREWLIHLIPIKGRAEEILVCLQDAYPNRHITENLNYLSFYDDITGLPNRSMFMKRLEDAVKESLREDQETALLLMDLDRFKRINETFGPDVGDMLLMQIAARLVRATNGQDIVARMQGDKFASLVTGFESEEQLVRQVESFLACMEEPFYIRDVPIHLTMSIAVVARVNSVNGNSPYMLLQQAELALSRLKKSKISGYLFYSPEMENHTLRQITLEHEMRQALIEGQFQLYYQPQVDMDNRITGVEALVRWNHPLRGMVSPAEFIPLAEENGFIVSLGEWVLEEACNQNKKWQSEGLPPIPVSVNLSVRQFERSNFPHTVKQVLQRTGLQAQYLDLEITETMTLDVTRARHVLNELKKLGVAISIDDFGTGYSSLHYLKSFPINRLKIDQSFVRDLKQDPNDAAIVSAIIALGHQMNLQVIAEGVETVEQLQFLQHHACDEIQGYFFSPPIPGPSFERMLRRQIA